MSSHAILFLFLTGFLGSSDAAAFVTKEANEVVVGADAKQQMMRRGAPDTDDDSKDSKANAKSDSSSKDSDASDSKSGADEAWKLKGPVSINLYYETRCPDCVEFINKTLEPLWRNQDLVGHLNVTLNPYGNAMSIPVAKVSEGYKFFHADTTGTDYDYVHVCQHGADECFGNTVQACAMHHAKQSKYMELVFCMAAKPDWGMEKSSYECLTEAKIDTEKIKDCVQSPKGNQLMAELGKQTAAVPNRQGTPWVMMGGVNLVDAASLMKAACGKLDNGPSSCSSFKSAPAPAPQDAPAPASDDDTFTVLTKNKNKGKKELLQVAMNMPKMV